jgi:hypothetical protein
MYFSGLPVEPMHFISDHTEAMVSVAQNNWVELCKDRVFFLSCYPHFRIRIRATYAHLKRGPRQDARLELFKDMVNSMHHYSGSQDMFLLLAKAAFDLINTVWKENACALWFWDYYCADPWGAWCLCMVEMAGDTICAIRTIHNTHVYCTYLRTVSPRRLSAGELLPGGMAQDCQGFHQALPAWGDHQVP